MNRFHKKSKLSKIYRFSDGPIYKLKKNLWTWLSFKIYTLASCPYNFSWDIGVYKSKNNSFPPQVLSYVLKLTIPFVFWLFCQCVTSVWQHWKRLYEHKLPVNWWIFTNLWCNMCKQCIFCSPKFINSVVLTLICVRQA